MQLSTAVASLCPLAVAALGCAGKPALPPEPPQPASAQLLFPPSISDSLELVDEDDYVVRVVAGSVTCSGTLIDSDQVLTAHHCVSQRDGEAIVPADVAPEEVQVELGGGYLPWANVGVRAIVAPPCGYSTGVGDIAVLVLDRRLSDDVKTLPPRLDEGPRVGESIEPSGFGLCPASETGIIRKSRNGGKLDAIRDSRFRLDASICPGDSGGPAIASTGELVGVISASAMDGSETTVGRSEFTRVDYWRPVFSNAKLISEGATPAEVPPLEGCPE